MKTMLSCRSFSCALIVVEGSNRLIQHRDVLHGDLLRSSRFLFQDIIIARFTGLAKCVSFGYSDCFKADGVLNYEIVRVMHNASGNSIAFIRAASTSCSLKCMSSSWSRASV
jgi:hypothetical protein